MKKLTPWCALLACTLGCQSTDWDGSPPVEDSWLAYVSDEDRQQQMDEARQRQDRLNQQLAAARSDLAESDSLLGLAESHLDALRVQLDRARDRIDHVRRFGTNTEFDAAQQRRDEIEAAVRLAESKASYYQAMQDLARERVTLLDLRADLADARLELAKARAVSELDRPVAEEIDVDDHRHTVRSLADRVEQARIDALVARELVKLRKEFVERKTSDVPQPLRTQEVEPIDAVFDAKAYEDETVKLEDYELAPARRPSGSGTQDAQRSRPGSGDMQDTPDTGTPADRDRGAPPTDTPPRDTPPPDRERGSSAQGR